jgi:hypothetical protein
MSTEKQFVNTLEDVIRSRGAMLITDSARVEISKQIVDILRSLCMMHGRANLTTNTRISPNTDGKLQAKRRLVHELEKCPGYAWLLLSEWIADVMNHTAEKSLN